MKNRNLIIAVVILAVLIFGYLKIFKAKPAKMYQAGDLMLQVSLSPNPPRVGDGKVIIVLMDDKHKLITDAKVAVNSGMPAMGNMPAMYSNTKAEMKGKGYEALLSISMLGTWDLALDIKTKNGKSQKANFKFSTGQKGLSYYPEDDSTSMDMTSVAQMVKLTSKQIKLAQVQSMPLKKQLVFQEIRTVGEVAFDPELQVAEEEYVAALGDDSIQDLVMKKLKLLGISQVELDRLNKYKKADDNLILPEKQAWVYAYVYEYELQTLKLGQSVTITAVSYPGQKFAGIVRSLVPVLDDKTRSQKVRIEVKRANNKLRPNMYVDVKLNIPLGHKYAIAKAALLQTGKQQLVYVDKGNGYYERRQIKVGPLAQTIINGEKLAVYPVLSGVKENEPVVLAANFLIDSQSELSGGMSGLYGSSAKEVKKEHQH